MSGNNYNQELLKVAFGKDSSASDSDDIDSKYQYLKNTYNEYVLGSREFCPNKIPRGSEKVGSQCDAIFGGHPAFTMAQSMQEKVAEIERNAQYIKQQEMGLPNTTIKKDPMPTATKIDDNITVRKYSDNTFKIKIQNNNSHTEYENISGSEKIFFVPDARVLIFRNNIINMKNLQWISYDDKTVVQHHNYKFILDGNKEPVAINTINTDSIEVKSMTVSEWYENNLKY